MVDTVKLICCKTMMDEIETLKPDHFLVDYVEYALHRTPDKLREELQKRIDNETKANLLIFVYGLCSRGLDGLKAGNKTLVIPRVHDCISLLLGSREIYEKEFGADPGTYYLSKGWIDQKADPYQEYVENKNKYGEENAHWISEQTYQHYRRLVFIDTGLPDLEDFEKYSKKVASFLNVEYIKIEGKDNFFKRIINKDWGKDFIIVKPGEVSNYLAFM